MEDQNAYERYQRQVILKDFGDTGQEKLLNARVLVIGAGGLGCPALQYLAAAGIGTIGIVDDDIVQLSNLHRQVLYAVADIGKSKAEKAGEILRALNPGIDIIAWKKRLTAKNAVSILNDFDIVIDGTDNFASRYMINDACVLLDKILVYGAVSTYEGQVAIFNKKDLNGSSVNYRDLFPDPPQQHEVPNCAEAGVLGVLPGIIGIMQANETIKLLTGIGVPLVNLILTYSSLTNEIYRAEIPARAATRSLIPIDQDAFENTDYEWLCGWTNSSSQEIDPSFLEVLLAEGEVDIIDVRETGETPLLDEVPHQKIPLGNLEQHIALVRRDTVVTICQSGGRSLQASKKLGDFFGPRKKIYSLRGGILAWKQHLKNITMTDKKPKNIFRPGAIPAAFIGESIQQHSSKTGIGAHSIFLGQVRTDEIGDKIVAAIEYTAYEEMALEKMSGIREDIFAKYSLTCMHVYHSLGVVSAGGICLFVFTSSAHRKSAIDACNETVERIKAELPVWGKELFSDETYQWKINS